MPRQRLAAPKVWTYGRVMNSSRLLDPELRALADAFPNVEMTRDGLPAMREAINAMFAAVPPTPSSDVNVETIMIPGPAGTLRTLLYRPAAGTSPVPAVLHIHGGGYVFGTPEMMDRANRSLAAELGCVIVSVEYRLAPETPHPGPVEDCFAALTWLDNNAGKLGVDRDRIGVKGESAGGGLAAAVALLARDRGGPRLAFQHLIYPMLDDRTCVTTDPHPFAGEFLWLPQQNHFGWSSLLGAAPGSDSISEYAAPARARQLAGLPATFIAVGALDLFLEEDLTFARRLSRAGVSVELHVYPGAIHGFHMALDSRVGRQLDRASVNAIKQGFEVGATEH
jgi:triacylglycerol lipase